MTSYIYGSVKISDFIPNNRHLREGTWIPYDLKSRGVERRFFSREQMLPQRKKNGFSLYRRTGWQKMDLLQQPNFVGTATSIDAIYPAIIRAMVRKSDFTALQRSMAHC